MSSLSPWWGAKQRHSRSLIYSYNMGVSYPRLCAGGLWLPGHEEKELLKALICLLKAVLSLVQGVLSENIPFYPMPWECGGFQDWLSGVEGGGGPRHTQQFSFHYAVAKRTLHCRYIGLHFSWGSLRRGLGRKTLGNRFYIPSRFYFLVFLPQNHEFWSQSDL